MVIVRQYHFFLLTIMLIQSERVQKALIAEEQKPRTVAIDVTEHPIERPKKQKKHYSGKSKRHTVTARTAIAVFLLKLGNLLRF